MSGKRYTDALKKIDRNKKYGIGDACEFLAQVSVDSRAPSKHAKNQKKWDQTCDLAVRLGVNPKHADQMVRGAVVYPNGTGKTTRVCVIAKGDKAKEALEAGADTVGAEDVIEKIQKENWFDFDSMVATPDMMGLVGRIGRLLGPKGLMPNPKVGTVTPDVGKAVRELKAGRVEFRVEKTGIVQARFGKASFGGKKLEDNLRAMLELLVKLKPSTSKGTYMRSVVISTTHGPGIKVNPSEVLAAELSK